MSSGIESADFDSECLDGRGLMPWNNSYVKIYTVTASVSLVRSLDIPHSKLVLQIFSEEHDTSGKIKFLPTLWNTTDKVYHRDIKLFASVNVVATILRGNTFLERI